MTRARPFPFSLLIAAIVACVAVPLAAPLNAQMGASESYNFLKAVRARDGGAAEQAMNNTNNLVVNTRDPSSGEAALHILTRGRDLGWLGFMLGRGARANIQTGDGTTPLHIAASIGWVEGAEQLLARGATVDMANNRGETPLILAVQSRQPQMIELLIRRGADPNRTDSVAGYSALDYARQDRRDAELVRLLEAAPARQPTQMMGPPAR